MSIHDCPHLSRHDAGSYSRQMASRDHPCSLKSIPKVLEGFAISNGMHFRRSTWINPGPKKLVLWIRSSEGRMNMISGKRSTYYHLVDGAENMPFFADKTSRLSGNIEKTECGESLPCWTHRPEWTTDRIKCSVSSVPVRLLIRQGQCPSKPTTNENKMQSHLSLFFLACA